LSHSGKPEAHIWSSPQQTPHVRAFEVVTSKAEICIVLVGPTIDTTTTPDSVHHHPARHHHATYTEISLHHDVIIIVNVIDSTHLYLQTPPSRKCSKDHGLKRESGAKSVANVQSRGPGSPGLGFLMKLGEVQK
jgi:hypothetical protein